MVVWFLPSWFLAFYLLPCFAIFFCTRYIYIFNQRIQHFLMKKFPRHKKVKRILEGTFLICHQCSVQEIVKDCEVWHSAAHGVTKSPPQLSDWTTTTCSVINILLYLFHHTFFPSVHLFINLIFWCKVNYRYR